MIKIADTKFIGFPLTPLIAGGGGGPWPAKVTYLNVTVENDMEEEFICYGLSGQIWSAGVQLVPPSAPNVNSFYIKIRNQKYAYWQNEWTNWFAQVGELNPAIVGSRPFWLPIPIRFIPHETVTIEVLSNILIANAPACTLLFIGGEYFKEMYENNISERGM